jgi:hypothetical protein
MRSLHVVRGVEAWLLDHDGHLSMTESRIGEVRDWLASRQPVVASGQRTNPFG